MIENPAKIIRFFSEKDLAKEFEKAKIMLLPAQDWSVRVSAMQRIAGIVAGGAFNEAFGIALRSIFHFDSD